MSHELRTPLNAVLGWVYLLRTGKLDQETSSRGLEAIDRNVRLQAQLTRDLLDVSHALTGELQVESRPTTLGEAVKQAIATVDSAARAKGVVLNVSMPDTPVVVLGDEAACVRSPGTCSRMRSSSPHAAGRSISSSKGRAERRG